MPSAAELRPSIGRAVRAKDPVAELHARQNYITQYAIEKLEAILARAPELRPEQLELIRSVIPAPSVDEEGAA